MVKIITKAMKKKVNKGIIAMITWAAVLCLPILKLCGAIDLKWWVVLAPFYVTLGACLLIAVIIAVIIFSGDVNDLDEL